MAYVGQQRHREGKKLVILSVKGHMSHTYTPTSKVICFIYLVFAFSGGRREPTGRIAIEDDDRGSLRFCCQAYGN
jgi:hypothetical protein